MDIYSFHMYIWEPTFQMPLYLRVEAKSIAYVCPRTPAHSHTQTFLEFS